MRIALALMAVAAWAAPPVMTELQPRGAERGRPFLLTIVGRELGEAPRIISPLPATFTLTVQQDPMMPANRYATFLVEPRADAAIGTYPLRVESAAGLSNVLFFTLGAFPETLEEESKPGAKPNSNDSIESAQVLSQSPLTVNGTLRGPERDLYRVYGKAGETRVFEVEARRAGSAIDPVIRILDAAGRLLARNEDALGIGLDARLEFTFPKEGHYYVEITDARFSRQEQNFYRLKMGDYKYAEDLFPLGGQRGTRPAVTFFGPRLGPGAPATANLEGAPAHATVTTIPLPDSPTLPLLFAIGDFPEVQEPQAKPLPLPVIVNGRLSKAGEIDEYRLAVKPGSHVLIETQARELGTSRLMGLLTIKDAAGKPLAVAGDEPLETSVTSVGQSLTARDPYLNVKIPDGVNEVTVTVEDLARRGGAGFGYRLIAREAQEDFVASLVSPFANIPAGGSMNVAVSVDRRGFKGPVQFVVANAPAGLKVEGGYIPAELDRTSGGSKVFSRRGVLVLTAESNRVAMPAELEVWAEGRTGDGQLLRRRARGPGASINVAGATAQGVVDRQRALTAPWLNAALPAALTEVPPATLTLELVERKRETEGDRYLFRWTWHVRNPDQRLPDSVDVDLPGINDIRIIEMKTSAEGRKTGTFVVTTTKVTMPAPYDLVVTGRLDLDGRTEFIYARPIKMEVTEVPAGAATGN
jgi:hypothetical protein